MSELVVTVRDREFRLVPGDVFTFGRHGGCTCVLDASDRGISRVAGTVWHEHGTWWVRNDSATRAVHVVDAVGLSVALPVVRTGWPPARREVDGDGVRVLVAGEARTHELRCTHAEVAEASTAEPPPESWSSTLRLPELTEPRRLVLVALVSRYLRPFPRYDPHPLSYAEIAALTHLPRSTVVKRVEAVRDQLREMGVPGLDAEDARRALAEYLLAARVVVPADLAWLHERVGG